MDDHPIMISVITPSFRQLEWLKLCAASVADQPGMVEHLIQDGGSGEDFGQWARSQGFADCRSEPDKGMYDAINRGFRRARGEILCWLNCDEQYLPDSLAIVAAHFERHPETDILFGDIVMVDEQLEPISYRHAVAPLRGQVRWNFLPTFSAATFVRRRIIDDGHLLDDSFRAIADAEWIHRLLGLGYKTAVLNQPLASFMQTGHNMGQSAEGIREARAWRERRSPVDHLRAGFHRAVHRLRKACSGGYGKWRIHSAIHHPGQNGRQPLKGEVGGTWNSMS